MRVLPKRETAASATSNRPLLKPEAAEQAQVLARASVPDRIRQVKDGHRVYYARSLNDLLEHPVGKPGEAW